MQRSLMNKEHGFQSMQMSCSSQPSQFQARLARALGLGNWATGQLGMAGIRGPRPGTGRRRRGRRRRGPSGPPAASASSAPPSPTLIFLTHTLCSAQGHTLVGGGEWWTGLGSSRLAAFFAAAPNQQAVHVVYRRPCGWELKRGWARGWTRRCDGFLATTRGAAGTGCALSRSCLAADQRRWTAGGGEGWVRWANSSWPAGSWPRGGLSSGTPPPSAAPPPPSSPCPTPPAPSPLLPPPPPSPLPLASQSSP